MSEPTLIAGYCIFLLSYLVFALGKFPGMRIDRTGAAIIGAVLMVAFRVVRPAGALQLIDFPTVVLLFSMMLVVAYLQLAGFFDWIAAVAVKQLNPQYLLPTIIFLTGVLSAFFVNDIICLVMVPFVLTATRRMRLLPVPYLLAVATASNIGSVATITGNPQNILIGSVSGIPYLTFIARLGPVAVAGLLVDWGIIWLLSVRNGAARADGGLQPSNGVAATMADPPGPELAPSEPIRPDLAKPGIVAGLVLAGFLAGFPPALVAALGGATMLITRTRDPRRVYEHIDWGLLVFFVGLFLIVGGAKNAGLTQQLLSWSRHLNLANTGVFTAITALLSNFVSNVPAVMLLKTIVPRFANPRSMWLLLAMASTLAGNLTITGSIANIIVVEGARPDAEIGFGQYFRIGLPVTVITVAIGWAWLALYAAR